MKELESGLKKMILGESLCTRINELESSAADMQTELEKLKAELSEKNALIDSLHSQLDETSKAAESARAEIKMLNDISARTGKVLSEAIERADMYESIMDAMPFYIQAVDDNLNWTFANKEFTSELQKAGIVGESRENLYGLNSVNDKVILCSTSENGFKKFVERGIQNSNYEMNGKKMYQETSELKNSSGEKLGLVSFSFDRTDVMKALEEAEKMAKIQKSIGAYQDAAVEKVIANLEKLAAGDLDMDLDLDEPTEDTKATAEKFEKLNDNLVRSVEAIRALVFDASYMAANAVDGYLDYRSDETKHGGEFAQVMRGLNATIDAVQAPIAEAMNILKRVADGDLNSRMMGNYKGEYANIQNIVNSTTINLQNYVAEMSLVLAEISRGNLNQEVTGDYRGDFCEMKNSLNNIINSLNDVMSDINDVSNNVNSSSRQVSDGAQKLSEGSARQATSVQQLSETVGVLSEQVRQNAADAMRANDLSKDVMNQADEGNRQMQEMLRAMEEINQSSANISKIIKVIDDIAFQTNILALNAAVEAARAGVHGKGFAVVADEVRSLASKSAQAANETTALIKGSIASVKAGSAITEKTAAALTKIVSGITETSSICGTIAEVSASQNESFNNVNREINEVNKVVQTNSSTAEESASSAQALYNQSQNMKQVVSTFKLKDGKTPSTSIMQSLIASTGARQLSEGVTDRSDMPIITLTLD